MNIKKLLGIVITLSTVLGISFEASSHHSFVGQFDPDRSEVFTGTVSGVRWVNPHAFFVIDVSNDDGASESWTFELGSPNTLIRYGWNRDTLKTGDVITVDGYLARSGAKLANAKIVTLANGTIIQAGSSYLEETQ
ncbi:DUF6152 family protein [Gammaproteobacteria bacterium]|nr:DUF6152 family protein [Gammaproteobacteria bacterium]